MDWLLQELRKGGPQKPVAFAGQCGSGMPSLVMTRAIVAEAKAAPEWRTTGWRSTPLENPPQPARLGQEGQRRTRLSNYYRGPYPPAYLTAPGTKEISNELISCLPLLDWSRWIRSFYIFRGLR